jgi:hypothetical protein
MLCCQKAFKGLRGVLCSTPDVVVMKGHDCAIGSRTGLRAMLFAGVLVLLLACTGTAAGATWVVDRCESVQENT